MDKLEREKSPKLFNAKTLVNFMAHAGPGTSLSIRVHSKDGTSVLGRTTWKDDRVGGPAVIFPNPDNKDEDFLIPLGGQVVYDTPPKINTFSSARAIGIPFGEVKAHQTPTNADAGNYSFELVSD